MKMTNRKLTEFSYVDIFTNSGRTSQETYVFITLTKRLKLFTETRL